MSTRNRTFLTLAVVAMACFALTTSSAQAGLILIDLGTNSGSAAGWDVFTADVTGAAVTDQNGIDIDVTLSIANAGGTNNPGAPGTSATIDGILVPKEARDDYMWGATNGGIITFEFENLDAGTYNVSVFEGRNDGNQRGKIWAGVVGDEPASENTGNISGGDSTVEVTISAGESVFYRHLEDNVGGTSGIIVNPIPEPATMSLLAIGGLGVLLKRRRRRA